VIPKYSKSDTEGLVIGWPAKKADMGKSLFVFAIYLAEHLIGQVTDDLKALHQDIKSRL